MLSFEDFRASGVRYSIADGLALLEITADYLAGTDTVALWVYDGHCYIEEEPEGYHLLLGRDEFQGDKAEMEARLYFDWYVDEASSNAAPKVDIPPREATHA